MIWVEFILCLVIIAFAGTNLVRYGDAIAEKTHLGRIWIGLVLLAAVTSMPELVTGVSSAAAWVGIPDLALGMLFGSCAINLAILAVLDILHRRTPVLTEASSEHHMLSAGCGILFIAIAAGGIVAGTRLSGLNLGWVGIPSIVILILYLVVMRQMFRFERSHQSPSAPAPRYAGLSARTVYFKFALAAGAVIAAGIWLSFIGDGIAEVTGWGATFVGSLFLAITTSAPELVVSVAALRLGAVDMAIADILGSNMLNIAVIVPVDLAYTPGAILSAVSNSHLIITAVVGVMSLIVIAGLTFRQKRKTFGVISWYAPILVALYIFGAYALYAG